MVSRVLKNKNKNLSLNENQINSIISKYSDNAEVAQNAKEAFAIAIKNQIISGRDANTLAPKRSATRAEEIVILRRLLKQME